MILKRTYYNECEEPISIERKIVDLETLEKEMEVIKKCYSYGEFDTTYQNNKITIYRDRNNDTTQYLYMSIELESLKGNLEND